MNAGSYTQGRMAGDFQSSRPDYPSGLRATWLVVSTETAIDIWFLVWRIFLYAVMGFI